MERPIRRFRPVPEDTFDLERYQQVVELESRLQEATQMIQAKQQAETRKAELARKRKLGILIIGASILLVVTFAFFNFKLLLAVTLLSVVYMSYSVFTAQELHEDEDM